LPRIAARMHGPHVAQRDERMALEDDCAFGPARGGHRAGSSDGGVHGIAARLDRPEAGRAGAAPIGALMTEDARSILSRIDLRAIHLSPAGRHTQYMLAGYLRHVFMVTSVLLAIALTIDLWPQLHLITDSQGH